MARKRKKQSSTLSYLIILILIASGAAAYYLFNRAQFERYEAFGIEVPINYSIHGIDVSRYQSKINWEEVAMMKVDNINISFSFIKATEGINGVDEKFKRNWQKAKEAGIPRGAYHFLNPSKSGKQQAENFIKTVKLEKGDLPPVLDIEHINNVSKTTLQKNVAEWLLIVEEKYQVKPIIYTNVDFYQQYLTEKFDDYPLWVAHYLAKHKPRINRSWLFWQYNENGHVNGINHTVDFNAFYGDTTAFKKILLQ